jgi:hypothetical protein
MAAGLTGPTSSFVSAVRAVKGANDASAAVSRFKAFKAGQQLARRAMSVDPREHEALAISR